jgi:polyisoprenoid-binding protein YceI
MKRFALLMLVLAWPTLSQSIVLKSQVTGSTATFALPYTFGIHQGTSNQVEGEVDLDPETLNLKSATFRVPLESIKTGKAEMECHLREALGLDYSKSKFPNEHVCKNNQLPTDGPDSMVYPEIVFSADPATLLIGENEIRGTWTVHGVSRPSHVSISVTKTQNTPLQLSIKGSEIFSLQEYGIKVKPFLVVKVKDKAIVTYQLTLAP